MPADSGNINLGTSSVYHNYWPSPNTRVVSPFHPQPLMQAGANLVTQNSRDPRPMKSLRDLQVCFMAKLSASYHNPAGVTGTSSVLQSAQITNDKRFSRSSKAIRSNLLIKSVSRKCEKSSISGEESHEDSCVFNPTYSHPSTAQIN